MSLRTYEDFIDRKTSLKDAGGFALNFMPAAAFDFQQDLIEWVVTRGRGAHFVDCGLGKSLMDLTYAENVVRHTNRPVLVATPLAVAPQLVREGEKFGIESRVSRDGRINSKIVVTNYEQLHRFDPADFVGFVGDESGCLKSSEAQRRDVVIEFCRKLPYRLFATATASPNDYEELGNHSEALGELGYVDMLGRFFRADDGRGAAAQRGWGQELKFRLMRHAEMAFWRWVCSWARAARMPSDLGYGNGDFVLPPLVEREHVIRPRMTRHRGTLFDMPAVGMREQRDERRRTLTERCEKVAELVSGTDCSLVWCQLNAEGDLLERLIPGAVQVTGSDPDEVKEERFLAFASGEIQRLVTKPRIGGWGLNFQNCAHQTYFADHSFEAYYQSVRRCWRFGQRRPVIVDVVATEGQYNVLRNIRRKAVQADEMFSTIVRLMNEAEGVRSNGSLVGMETPGWL